MQLTRLGLTQRPAQFKQIFTKGKGEQDPDNSVSPNGRSSQEKIRSENGVADNGGGDVVGALALVTSLAKTTAEAGRKTNPTRSANSSLLRWVGHGAVGGRPGGALPD